MLQLDALFLLQFLRNLRNLVVWEDFVYWVDGENQELLRVNKLTGQNRSVVISNLNRPYDVVVYHPLMQPAGIDNNVALYTFHSVDNPNWFLL